MKELGLINKNAKPYPWLSNVPTWDQLTSSQKRREIRQMEVYAGMVENMDYEIGRMIRHLKKIGEYDNTLIVFFSDNGPNAGTELSYPDSMKDGGAWLRSNFDNRLKNLGKINSFVAVGPGWAQVSAGPYRYAKGVTSEGGLIAPLIIRGPRVPRNGATSHALLHVIDIMPTFWT